MSEKAKGRRRRYSDEKVRAAVEEELARTHKKFRRNMCGVRESEVVHPRFGKTVTVELRTGNGVKVRVIRRSDAFRRHDGVVRQSAGQCNPAVHHCMDGFYGKIDHDIREWQLAQDAKLRVPYAVKEMRRRKREWKAVRKDAINRGIV